MLFRVSNLRKPYIPQDILLNFQNQLKEAKENYGEFEVLSEYHDNRAAPPKKYNHFECEFASKKINQLDPRIILDIGSYRYWLIGIMAGYQVITLDVQNRDSILANERVITDDVLNIDLLPSSVDMVTSLCSVEHIGLGRYGDRFDLQGDKKAIQKLIQIIKPGGHFIFTVPVTLGKPCLNFNAHRIYSLEMIKKWSDKLVCEEEMFIKRKPLTICKESEITSRLGEFDVYCGCYRKG